MAQKVRTRYAPSPTGFQHIGGIRTALYAYLFAQKHNGKLILRIEDTDQKRYVEGAEEYIVESLKWLGINCNEGVRKGGNYGPYRQSERRDLYREYAYQLVEKGWAYFAFDTPEQLDAMRKRLSEKNAVVQQYNALTRMQMTNSLSLPLEQAIERMEKGERFVIRFKLPEDRDVVVKDEIRGDVVFNTTQMSDQILFKSDGWPTYHLANIVDDHLMKITHVIRGEEWLPSTPLHVLLYEAFEWEAPAFAHLPLLLNPNGKGKLSKRTGDKLGFPVFPLAWEHPTEDKSSDGYREMGFIKEAFVNFLAFLGWNPGTTQEIFSMKELVEAFSLDRVNKSGAKFDFDKAKWFNEQYLRNLSDEDLAEMVWDSKPDDVDCDTKIVSQLVGMMKERMTFPSDFWAGTQYFFNRPTAYDEKTIRKKWNDANKTHLEAIKNKLEGLQDYTADNIEKTIKSHIEKHELKFGDILLPFRLMLTGEKGGPSVFDIAAILGQAEVNERILEAFHKFDEIVVI